LILALWIASLARERAAKAEALGSIEELAVMASRVTDVVHELQAERALAALTGGAIAAAEGADGSTPARLGSGRLALWRQQTMAQVKKTDRSVLALDAFLDGRDLSRLPPRLATALQGARQPLRELPVFRSKSSAVGLSDLLDQYGRANRQLIDATAALTDLTDDGDLLRGLTSLVSVLEVTERASREHALLAHVFARGEFPPGSYRDLVTLVTEEATYSAVLGTTASTETFRLYQGNLTGDAVQRTLTMRRAALETSEEELQIDPQIWFDLQRTKIDGLTRVEHAINSQVRKGATAKLAEINRTLWISTSMTIIVLALSVVMAWVIGRGVTRNVGRLREATARLGHGDLSVRVDVGSNDELGELGGAFNRMVEEVEAGRAALGQQARMSRELEIAANIQRALLPPDPTHDELEFAGRMRPADEVGGDFYDVLRDAGDGKLWITVGDVSGHGVEAGLVMLMTQAAFASRFVANPGEAPDRVLQGVNVLLYQNIVHRLRNSMYVTAQLLRYDGAGCFTSVGAHQWPVVFRVRTGRCEIVETPGPWIGILPTLPDVPLTQLSLEPGDILCLYSDGLTEARNEQGTLFDLPRLASVLGKAASQHAELQSIADAIFEGVEEHTNQRDDDWTLLLVRRSERVIAHAKN
jgi:serine phosphatase RsbU (regulator of sigma subunit)